MVKNAQIEEIVKQELDAMQRDRRHLHRHPEMSFEEKETSSYICESLDAACIPYEKGVGGPWGVVARIKGEEEGPCIAFRADMDALGIKEKTGLPYQSENEGVMHACGHDVHTTVLLALARVLNAHRELVKGEAVLIFQYAEELPPGGAGPMIEAGCLEGVDRIYGMHVEDQLPVGEVGVREGPYMAASDSFFVEIRGGGGHGSRPYETQDTVTAAAMAILNINQIVSRTVDPFDSVVISVCQIEGGISYNIIPPLVSFSGTVRTYRRENAELVKEKVETAIRTACQMYGAEYDYRFEHGYPSVCNSERESEVVRRAAERTGKYPCRKIPPTTVGEDFSRYLEKVPGAFFRVGIRNPEINAVYPLHHSCFQADERAMGIALEMFLQIYMEETGQ